MHRWQRFWREPVAGGLLAIVVGIVAERQSYGLSEVRHWLPDLLTGWILIGCGLLVRSRAGLWLALTGFTWFAGSLVSVAVVLHRGPLSQLALTFPTGRTSGHVDRAVVGFAYVVAVVTAFWLSDAGTALLALALATASLYGYRRSFGARRRELQYGVRASLALAALFGLLLVFDVVLTTRQERNATLLGYEVALVLLAGWLTLALAQAPWRRPRVADLVVELGEGRASTLRDELARALGDRSLQVGYRVDGGYVDASGEPVAFPEEGDPRRITRLERSGEEVAILIHDPVVLADPTVFEAIAAGARLTAENARLQAEVRAQVAELSASRRRLLAARDDERRRLERRLHDGAVSRLIALKGTLAEIREPYVAHASAQLDGTLFDLHELAAGLHPRELSERGLAVALGSLAARAPAPVELSVPADRFEPELEATAYFVCSEALANVAKYAKASRVVVAVSLRETEVHVEVWDDGLGGASTDAGTGLRGLSDRVETLGGSFEVESPEGAGTRLLATMPR